MWSRRRFLETLAAMPVVGSLVGSTVPAAAAMARSSGRDYFRELGVRPFINAAGTYTAMTASLMPPEVMDANTYASKGVLFVGINSNKTEDSSAAVAHAKSHGHTFPIMKDPSNKVADLYDAKRTPEVYVIDPEGKLRYHGRITEDHENPASSPDLKNALDSFLTGKPIARTETKAFGCTIKRV